MLPATRFTGTGFCAGPKKATRTHTRVRVYPHTRTGYPYPCYALGTDNSEQRITPPNSRLTALVDQGKEVIETER
jgi:hypothetical protein